MSDPFAQLDATDQAALVLRGEVSAAELVDAAIDRIARVDPQLGAVIHVQADEARTRAAGTLPAGPFRGVPFLLKDLGSGNRRGDPEHMGTRYLRDAGHLAAHSSHLVEQFERAGLVVVGRSNVPTLGAWSVTEPEVYGPTRNPWSLEHSAGGSSGGAAAATAAGLVPFAHASDGGGSIRNPASQCGLVGLKPSRGRVSHGPDAADGWSGLISELAVTRSVRDTAALLDCVHGPRVGDPYTAPPPARRFSDEVGAAVAPLRIGFVEREPLGGPLHPECAAAMQRALRALESLGHHVEPSRPAPIEQGERFASVLTIVAAHQAADVARHESWMGRAVGPADLDCDNWRVTEIGRALSATEYLAALDALNACRREMLTWWEQGFALLVTPTITRLSPRIGEIVPDPSRPLDAFSRSGALLSFCIPFNVTGQPAISLPIHTSEAGLPVGVQLVADTAREDILIRVASQLEGAIGWAARRPPVHA